MNVGLFSLLFVIEEIEIVITVGVVEVALY